MNCEICSRNTKFFFVKSDNYTIETVTGEKVKGENKICFPVCSFCGCVKTSGFVKRFHELIVEERLSHSLKNNISYLFQRCQKKLHKSKVPNSKKKKLN